MSPSCRSGASLVVSSAVKSNHKNQPTHQVTLREIPPPLTHGPALFLGVGSDFLVKALHASRVWCLVVASLIFTLAQLCALNIVNPHYLGFVSALSGLGYGFLLPDPSIRNPTRPESRQPRSLVGLGAASG